MPNTTVISVVATKGGVGKTTLAANIAGLLADMNMRVLAIDADMQPSLSKYCWCRAVLANPLAGSAPRCVDPEQDRAVGAALLMSHKDRREHAFVVEAVAASLKPYCIELSVPDQPALMQTAAMWHLSTQVRGQLRDSATCALRLATALHPTPAICGTPTAQAQATICSLEGFERGYYAGLVATARLNLKRFLRDCGVADFKLPDRLELLPSFALTGVGKVSKKALREMIAAKLAAERDAADAAPLHATPVEPHAQHAQAVSRPPAASASSSPQVQS